MEDQNCTVTQSLNSALTNSPMSPAVLEPAKTTSTVTESVPVGMGVAGEKSDAVGSEVPLKRKRGRPRKNDFNRNLLSTAVASAGFSSSPFGSSFKRSRGRPRGSGRLQLLASMGGILSDTAGGSLTPHVLVVNRGEDVVTMISSISQTGPLSVCILTATGSLSNAIIRHSGSSGGSLRYEGFFEILTLKGSCLFRGGSHRKSLIMSVSLAKPDGSVFGGLVDGPLIAAGPIQLVVASFKQNISNDIKRRLSPGSSSAANVIDDPDSSRLPLQVPRMIEDQQSFPSPTSGLMPTTNGVRDHVMSGISNGFPDNVTSTSTANGLPENFFHHNMHPSSLNGVGLDCHVLQPLTVHMNFGDVNNNISQL